ncbi:MAG: TolC family protein [Gemmataceae bacterium]|nr:TolC family protein [Gemmataceae bacterium]
MPTALRLAGASNLQIAIAVERINEAEARWQGSKAAWFPSLYGGAGYTRHNGQIQDTSGEVIEVTRSSLFVGGGPALGSTISGSAASPRVGADLSLTDAFFGPLVQRQLVQAARAAYNSTLNDTLLQVGLTYFDLTQAQGQVVVAQEAVKNADELVQILVNRVKAKTAPPADLYRVQAELAERRCQFLQAEEFVRVISAELVRLLRLDPTTVLLPADHKALPVSFVDENAALTELIGQGVANRPEVAERQAVVNASAERWRQERWRPAVPSMHVSFSAGGFGGGKDAFVGDFRDRADFDAMLVWQLKNLGFGNRALQRERASQSQQALLSAAQVQDLVASEVAAAYHQVQFRKKQLDASRTQVEAAEKALPLNFIGIKGDVLRAIEAQQAIQALASARARHLETVVSLNRAHLALWRSVGIPLQSVPAD